MFACKTHERAKAKRMTWNRVCYRRAAVRKVPWAEQRHALTKTTASGRDVGGALRAVAAGGRSGLVPTVRKGPGLTKCDKAAETLSTEA